MASGEAAGGPASMTMSMTMTMPMPMTMVSSNPNPQPQKKKRSLPGTPDPAAEVIALSPRTLLATNRFVCEICGKGFQRDQNLQLHRRGHNLPWKLRQRSGKEPPRKRVYVCPEKSCVHHSAHRALGDLTGIKKHFCRKHGEKRWKCDKCGKRYAVQSDWKAHGKTCGTREYRCDCGTLFSRRDSFVTHRAFCDALAQETARVSFSSGAAAAAAAFFAPTGGEATTSSSLSHLWDTTTTTTATSLDALAWLHDGTKLAAPDLMMTTSVPSVFSGQHPAKAPEAADVMSATALLQKAAQMGAVTSSPSNDNANNIINAMPLPLPLVDAAAGAMPSPSLFGGQGVLGREETRDFLGVGVHAAQAAASLQLRGWI